MGLDFALAQVVIKIRDLGDIVRNPVHLRCTRLFIINILHEHIQSQQKAPYPILGYCILYTALDRAGQVCRLKHPGLGSLTGTSWAGLVGLVRLPRGASPVLARLGRDAVEVHSLTHRVREVICMVCK